jgi:hypothetical protein
MPAITTALQIFNYGLRLIDKEYQIHRRNKVDHRIDQFRNAFGSHPLLASAINEQSIRVGKVTRLNTCSVWTSSWVN